MDFAGESKNVVSDMGVTVNQGLVMPLGSLHTNSTLTDPPQVRHQFSHFGALSVLHDLREFLKRLLHAGANVRSVLLQIRQLPCSEHLHTLFFTSDLKSE